jgi:hypothetical protein
VSGDEADIRLDPHLLFRTTVDGDPNGVVMHCP